VSETRRVEVDGQPVAFDAAREGPAVVMLSGLNRGRRRAADDEPPPTVTGDVDI